MYVDDSYNVNRGETQDILHDLNTTEPGVNDCLQKRMKKEML